MAHFESSTAGPAKQRIRQAFEQAASTYDAAADVQREVCDRLGAYLLACDLPLSPKAILDAGCGTGYGADWLRQRWPQARLTLIDFAPAMLAAARGRCLDTQLICADIEALPLVEYGFDLYWSSLAWQWNDPGRCFAEVERVLEAGGIMAVATLGTNNFPELRQVFAGVDDYSHVLTIPAPERLLAACQAAGWQVRVWERRLVRRHYPDVRTLLRSVKAVGAREVQQRRPAPFSRAAWQAIAARYERLRQPAGLPLSYDAVWLIATR
ncbi:MAG: malonyl-ACP O-methyltransferase BioC [Candidatus Competibacteraceae bacterium]|nr:malonyl-ACP O-methyltransferase BioC [Candidatus Competibacteraceae bacterium]